MYLWRATDEQGQVLDTLMQARRDTSAAERFFRRPLDGVGPAPERIVTDKLASYAAAKARIPDLKMAKHVHVRAAARLNNRSSARTRRRACESGGCDASSLPLLPSGSSPFSAESATTSNSSAISSQLFSIGSFSGYVSEPGEN